MRLELIVVMFRVELEALDLDAAGRFLKDAAHDQSNLERHLPRLADSLQSRLMKAVVALLEAAKRLHPVAQAVLMERRSLSREDVRRLKEVDDLLFDAKELALEGGQGGASYLYTISQLQRFRLSLLKAGSVNASDFGRMAGPISAATLVALMVTIHLTFAPTGLSAIGFFFGAVVVSLIAGFGYGALRFRPLLELVRQEIQRAEDE
jgi:hypothetical protein